MMKLLIMLFNEIDYIFNNENWECIRQKIPTGRYGRIFGSRKWYKVYYDVYRNNKNGQLRKGWKYLM